MEDFGNRIEEYDVFELLGTGGFAVVHRARCKKTGYDVAIKMIDVKRIETGGMKKRVEQEATIHSRLKHPSILQLYTIFQDHKFVYLVLELCHNGELQRYLKTANSVLSEPEACSILKQIVEGLLYLHSHQIMHRDIKLDNILLTKNMKVKIADFGLATQLKRPDEKHMTMCGTPNYISPEVATRGSHGLATDLWGLGIVLYTCLVGKPPFDTDDGLNSVLTKVVMSDIKLPSFLSTEAQALLKSLLKKNPQDRISLKEILEHPFMLKCNSASMSGPMQRCISYDSGVATASYMTSQPYHSYSHGMFPTSTKSGSFRSCRPTSPIGRQFSSEMPPHYGESINCVSREGDAISDSCCNGHSRQSSHHPFLKPSLTQNHRNMDIEHSLIPNRFVPFGTSSQNQQNQYNSVVSKHSGICMDGNSCSHAWRQCKQCSHIDSCGCNAPQRSYCSTGSKIDDNHNHNNHLQPQPKSFSRQEIKTSTKEKIIGNCYTSVPNVTLSTQKIPVAPIDSRRLRPVRQKTKNVIVSILTTGDICLEFIKNREGQDKVWEVMRISSDGIRIIMYQPKKGKGVPISESPPPLPAAGADAIYNYENIPEKHWKKYSYASKFVDLVKSKTPKITYYSVNAKCFLMENMPVPDFEACFYNGGKINRVQSRVTVLDITGKSWAFDFYDDNLNFSSDVQSMWEHFKKCLDHCLMLNKCMGDFGTTSEEAVFPVIIGRRPSSNSSPLSNANCQKENLSPQSVVNIPTMRGYESSIASTRFEGKNAMIRKLTQQMEIVVPGIGNVSQLPNGEIHIKYFDSTKMIVNPDSPQVLFVNSNGKMINYRQDDVIPDGVRSRLAQMPMIIKTILDSV